MSASITLFQQVSSPTSWKLDKISLEKFKSENGVREIDEALYFDQTD